MRKRDGMTEEVLVSGTPEEVRAAMKRLSRRSFAWGAVAAVAGWIGFDKLRSMAEVDGIGGGFRAALGTNEKLFRGFYSPTRRIEEHPLNSPVGERVNGTYGLGDDFAPEDWKLSLDDGKGQPVLISLDEIKALPRYEMVTELRCIEGWSILVHWTGARFADFAQKYASNQVSRPYVAMETPDGEYYVGLDTESVMHPQTLLCYEMNGTPLTLPHGAPLRLAIPVKYGVKNIKRIGTIAFSDERPKDYWAEQGYDWYCGL